MNPGQHILVFVLRLYRRLVSPLLTAVFGPMGLGCRFTPTCSEFAIEAVKVHGVLRGCWLAIARLGRCHPWGGSGFDPVPPASVLDARSMVAWKSGTDRSDTPHPGPLSGKPGVPVQGVQAACCGGTSRATTHFVSRSNGS